MTRRLGRRSGAAAALLTVLLVIVPASPAAADALVTIDSPRAGPPLTSGSVAVSGSASSDAPLVYLVKSVRLSVGDKVRDVECTQQPCRFSWTVTLPLNGPYELKVRATEATVVGGIPVAPKDVARSFAVAAPPARPVMDKPTVNEARNVEVSWTRNTEPDMLYYALFRKDPGASSFNRVGGEIAQRPSGAKITFTDTATSAFDGGDYAYQVVAVRKGASGTADTQAKSDPSGAGTVSVPPPASTTTSIAGPPGAPGAPTTAGPTTTLKPGAAAGVDLRGFLAGRPPAVPVSPITIPEPPDTGFGGTLPFGAPPPGEELEEGEAEAVPPRGRTSVITRIESGRPLVPVAGGLVMLLLALHLRLLNRRIKAADAADLPVDRAPTPPPAPPIPAAPVAARAPSGATLAVTTAPAPEPEPAPAFYDGAEDEAWDEGWDEEWAPPAEIEAAIQPEIEPEIEPVIEPEADREPVVVGTSAGDGDFEIDFELEDDPGPVAEEAPNDEIEVFEVVSPAPRRLVRAGSR